MSVVAWGEAGAAAAVVEAEAEVEVEVKVEVDGCVLSWSIALVGLDAGLELD
jgi:hypothetical protein